MKLPLPNSRQRQRVPYVGCQDRFPGWQEATLGHSWRLCLCITATKYLILGGGGRNRTGVHGFAGRCMTTLPPRRVGPARRQSAARRYKLRGRALALPRNTGAGKESRTPDLNLGKVALYQLSYSRVG